MDICQVETEPSINISSACGNYSCFTFYLLENLPVYDVIPVSHC